MNTIWQLRALILVLVFLLIGCGNDSSNTYVDVEYCDQLVSTDPSSASGADPLLDYQWYLDRVGIKDLWSQGYTGQEVHISIVDDALEIEHEDLVKNIVPGQSRNYLEPTFSNMRFNPMPVDCGEDGHGTAVAGILAAEGYNRIGIKGIAYEAGIYLDNYLASQLDSNLRSAMGGMGRHTSDTAVSSNSWGSGTTSRLRRQDGLTRLVIEDRLIEGFNGTGVSYVFAAGNSREISMDNEPVDADSIDMASYTEMLNYPGMIVVCAVNVANSVASYSNPGANLWVCGPSGDNVDIDTDKLDNDPYFLNYYHRGLPTVDLSSEAGYNQPAVKPSINSEVTVIELGDYLNFGWGGFQLNFTVHNGNQERLEVISHQDPANVPPLNPDDALSVYRQPGNSHYTRFFQGTSAATPVVSGIIALLRAEHRKLTWRDIMLILAESAEQVAPSDASWQVGASAYHDSSKDYTHSIDYGFGLVNATAAMELATDNWVLLPAAEEPYRTDRVEGKLDATRKEFEIEVPDIQIDFLEYVQVDIRSDYPDFGHLDIKLISPQDQESVLTRSHKCLDWNDDLTSAKATGERDCPDLQDGFTFASAAYLGADPMGTWKLRMRIEGIEDIQFTPPDLSWRLIFHGFNK